MEEEKLYLVANDECYVEIHLNADGEWDYTLYDYKLNEIDGGVISCLEKNYPILIICALHQMDFSRLYKLDHETFETIRELMNK